MDDPEDTEAKETAEAVEDQPPFLDPGANLDYSSEDQVPRVKGLIELFGKYIGD